MHVLLISNKMLLSYTKYIINYLLVGLYLPSVIPQLTNISISLASRSVSAFEDNQPNVKLIDSHNQPGYSSKVILLNIGYKLLLMLLNMCLTCQESATYKAKRSAKAETHYCRLHEEDRCNYFRHRKFKP